MTRIPHPLSAFEQFAERENAAAAGIIMARALGATPSSETEETNGKLARMIQGILDEQLATLQGKTPDASLDTSPDTSPDTPPDTPQDASPDTLKVAEIIAAKIDTILPKLGPTQMSMLDIITTGLTQDEQIKAELKRHGINLDTQKGRQYAYNVMKRAIDFFDNQVADNAKEKLPPSLNTARRVTDIYRIFKTASGQLEQGKTTRNNVRQACALLRIAAVIEYIDKDPHLSILDEAFEALQELKNQHFEEIRDSEGQKTIRFKSKPGDMINPVIYRIFERSKKMESIIAKLLLSPETDSRSIMDGLGITILTGSKKDSLLLIYKMFFDPDTAILSPINIRPKHAKNLLLDEKILSEALTDPKKAEALIGQITQKQQVSTLTNKDKPTSDHSNESSMSAYTDIIHLIVEFHITLKNGDRRSIPIEFQIKDVVRNGIIEQKAPHTKYKQIQREKMKERVLGNNLYIEFQRDKGNGRRKRKKSGKRRK